MDHPNLSARTINELRASCIAPRYYNCQRNGYITKYKIFILPSILL